MTSQIQMSDAAWIEVERARCIALTKLIARGAGKDFLLYCLDAPWHPDEIEQARQRFAELTPDVEDIL